MSTRALVAIEMEDGSVQSIYNHYDGYIHGGLGETLYKHYQDRSKVEKLISMGGASYITPVIGDKKNDFNNSDSDISCFYHRDRGEDLIIEEAINNSDWCLSLKGDFMIEWAYLFELDGKWKVINPAGTEFPLDEPFNGGNE